jgi:hypothetical protein
MGTFAQDLIFALRMMRKNLGFTAAGKNHAQTDAAQLCRYRNLGLARSIRTWGYYGGAGGPVRTMRPRSKFSTDQFPHRIGRMMVGKSLIQLGLRGAAMHRTHQSHPSFPL